MALSEITRQQARSDLRSRLGNVTAENLVDDELNFWLHIGQIDTANRLSSISNQWYGHTNLGVAVNNLSAGAVTLHALGSSPGPEDVLRFTLIVGTAAAIDGKVYSWARLEELYSYIGMSTYSNHLAAAVHGEGLYMFTGSDYTPTGSETVTIHSINKPEALYGSGATDSTVMDTPDEFYDLVIMNAQSKAYQKLGNIQSKTDLDRDINQRLQEVRGSFAQEMQMWNMELPQGQQTVRGK